MVARGDSNCGGVWVGTVATHAQPSINDIIDRETTNARSKYQDLRRRRPERISGSGATMPVKVARIHKNAWLYCSGEDEKPSIIPRRTVVHK